MTDIITKIANEIYKGIKDEKRIPEDILMEHISDYDSLVLKMVKSKLRKKGVKIFK